MYKVSGSMGASQLKREPMEKLMNFIYYNIFVYIIYYLIDTLFDLLNLYSNHNLGKDIMVMPTQTDMILVGINIMISLVLSMILLNRLKVLRQG